MATQNACYIRAAGIVKYDGAGNFTSAGLPLDVPNGGTGVTSNTAYAVLCGGTTSTNPIQSIASVGTAGQVLVSNGPSALPTFQTVSPDKFVIYWQINSSSVVASTRYYLVNGGVTLNTYTNNTTSYSTRTYIPISGSINVCYGQVNVSSGTGTGGFMTLGIRHNDTTDYVITSAITRTTGIKSVSNTALGITVSAGDFIELYLSTPSGTQPGGVGVSVSILVS